MSKRVLSIVLALAAVAPAGTASADPGGEGQMSGPVDPIVAALITDDDLFSTADLITILADPTSANATRRYGPYPSGSPDSGTCGNLWAEDEYDRVFTVRQTGLTTYTVVQQFKNGTFVTNEGPSPGACQADDGSTTLLVAGGLVGTMHGYFVISVTNATVYNTDPDCVPAGPCTTAGFIGHHFPGSAFTIGTFFFHYAGYDGTNQVLVEHEWKNASDDRGGNHGDIATE